MVDEIEPIASAHEAAVHLDRARTRFREAHAALEHARTDLLRAQALTARTAHS